MAKLLSVLCTKITSVTSLPSCHQNFCSSDCYPPKPSLIREGGCSRKSDLQANNCHCERQNGASQSHNLCNINEITTSNASHSPRNDIESLCRTQMAGAAATLPQRGEGISKKLLKHRGQSDVRKILKQVQDDRNISLKPTDSLINLFSYSPRKRCAFTLAEVLITLGIIGVVAAMTMPVLIANHQKKQVGVKLAKFYSVMNQALIRWENENGIITEDIKFSDRTSDTLAAWYDEAIGKYVQTVKKEQDRQYLKVAFNDGSGFVAYIQSSLAGIYFFYCTEYKYCKEESFDGKRTFVFSLHKGRLEPYGSQYNYSREQVLEACKYGNTDDPEISSKGRRHFCARLIQMDGWEIKDDYPWNQIILEN